VTSSVAVFETAMWVKSM